MPVDRTLIDELYAWYELAFWRVEDLRRSDVPGTPGKQEENSARDPMSKEQFVNRIQWEWDQSSTKQQWIDRFVHGHEDALSRLETGVQNYLKNCRLPLPVGLGGTSIPATHVNWTTSSESAPAHRPAGNE